jgi:hypothetical protein
VATALAHLNQPPPPLPDTVPVGIRTVISAALAKDPADRPQTAAAMARALRMPDAAFAPLAGSQSPAARTQTMPAQAAPAAFTPAFDSAARTRLMPVLPRPAERPGIQDRRRGLRPAWLLAGAAAAVFFVLVAFALPGNDQSVQTPAVPAVTATTSPTPIQDGANESTTTEIARPAEDSPMPAQPHRTRGKDRGHDQNKDGK